MERNVDFLIDSPDWNASALTASLRNELYAVKLAPLKRGQMTFAFMAMDDA